MRMRRYGRPLMGHREHGERRAEKDLCLLGILNMLHLV